jgi:hypothetical protein
MGSADPRDIIVELTRQLAQQNDAFFPDEHGRREADARLAKEIVAEFNLGVTGAGGDARVQVFEATSLERARGGFHVNIAALQPPGDTRRVPLKAFIIAQVMIEPSHEAAMHTTVSVRPTRAPADPWRPPPEFKYDRARKALTDLEQTIVAARSMKGANEPWQALPMFEYDPIAREWIGAKQAVIAALAALVRSWMSMRSEGSPPSSPLSSPLSTTESQPADSSG